MWGLPQQQPASSPRRNLGARSPRAAAAAAGGGGDPKLARTGGGGAAAVFAAARKTLLVKMGEVRTRLPVCPWCIDFTCGTV